MARTPEGPWKDGVLRALAKRPVSFPLVVEELTHAAVRRKLHWLVGVLAAFLFLFLAVTFLAAGVFPGFADRGAQGSERELLLILLGVPAGAALLVWFVAHPRTKRRADEDDHPWRLAMTDAGLSIATASGRRLAGPWRDWGYGGYRYLSMKGNRIPTALVVIFAGEEVMVEFSRFRRRDGGLVARGLLQGLTSAGRRDH